MNTMGATNKGGETPGLNNSSEITRRTLFAGFLGLWVTSVTACFGGGKTDTTPGPALTVAGEATPGVTNPPIPETTTPTPESPSVVEPLREWNVPADTLQRLQEATSSEDRRVILNELIKAHDPEYRPSVVDGKQFFEGSAERLFDGIARQIRIIGELGCDPNTQKIGGLEIAKVWAEEVFADRQYGQQFIEQVEHWLYALSDSDPQEAQAMRNVFREEFGPFDYELLVSTKQATGFHNEVTGKDFHGITAVAVTRQYDGKKAEQCAGAWLVAEFCSKS